MSKKSETNNILKGLVDSITDESTALLSDDLYKDETQTFFDTGSYLLNGLISTSLFGRCSR